VALEAANDPRRRRYSFFLSHNMVELFQLTQAIGLATWSTNATIHGAVPDWTFRP
jgi:hypothetical protein